MKYIVMKRFYDRFDGMKLNEPGDEHVPANERRAAQLVSQGFIAVAEDDGAGEDGLKPLGGGYYELPNGDKVQGKEKALEALAALQAADL